MQISIDGMNKCLSNLDSRADKQRFLEAAFMIPKKFDAATFQNKIDEVKSFFSFFHISIGYFGSPRFLASSQVGRSLIFMNGASHVIKI